MVKIPVPFKSARAEEAEAATSQSFKDITLRRINRPEFRQAAKAFLKAFEDARKAAFKRKPVICVDCCKPIQGKVIDEMCETCHAWNNRFDRKEND